MLLLEESASLLNRDVHRQVVEATLKRYLEVGATEPGKVPRFLLNDVTRYWHTITVDYQAKARSGPESAGLRYIKLVIPRKVLYAGTLMSLLLCGRPGFHRATVEDLSLQFSDTPLQRLVQGHPAAEGTQQKVADAMRGVVEIVDTYLEHSGDDDWRSQVKRGSKASPTPEFQEACEWADTLQEHLESIFFDWTELSGRSRRLLVF